MNAPGHVWSGVVSGLATAPIATDGFLSGVAWVGIVTVSTLAPDIDHGRSTISRSLGPITGALSWVLQLFTKHRGFTHRDVGILLWACLLAAMCSYTGLPMWVAVASATGCVVHVLGDGLTDAGVRPFQLLPKYKLRLTPMNAGGFVERFIVIPALMIASAWLLVGLAL